MQCIALWVSFYYNMFHNFVSLDGSQNVYEQLGCTWKVSKINMQIVVSSATTPLQVVRSLTVPSHVLCQQKVLASVVQNENILNSMRFAQTVGNCSIAINKIHMNLDSSRKRSLILHLTSFFNLLILFLTV